MLTRSSWVKIAAIVLLCLVLCTAIGSCSFGCTPLVRGCTALPWVPNWTAEDYPNAGNGSIRADQVRNIDLDWLAGRTEFNVVDDAQVTDITFEESVDWGELRDGLRLCWTLDGDTLRIGYWESSTTLTGCAGPNWQSKKLKLTIPKSACEHLGTVSIDAFSGEYNLDGLSCQRLQMDLASGLVEGSDTSFESVNVEVASGLFNLEGRIANEFSLEMASGNADLTCIDAAPHIINVSMASGNVTFVMPNDAGITANVSKVSGNFVFDMPDSHTYDDSYICGDGSARLDVEMTSGNVTVRS